MIKASEKYIKTLTLSWWRSLSYSNQSTDLLCKSMDWFLYDRDLRRERANVLSSFHYVNWDKFSTTYFLPELFSSAISPLIVLPFCTKIKKTKRSWKHLLCTYWGVLESSQTAVVNFFAKVVKVLGLVYGLSFGHQLFFQKGPSDMFGMILNTTPDINTLPEISIFHT